MGPKPKHFHSVCVPSEGGKKRRRARHLWYSYGVAKTTTKNGARHARDDTADPALIQPIPPPRDPPRVAQCGHGSPGATGADGAQRPHRLVDRAVGTIRDTRVRSAIRCRICCGLDSCCWGRAGATSPTPTACVRIRACGWRARPVGARRPWRRARGWRHSRPCPDCWTRSAGRRTFRSCTKR